MRRVDDRGSASLELTLLTPVFLAVLMLVVFVGRRADVAGDVRQAAKVAAREATLHASFDEGRRAGIIAATASLGERAVSCPSPDVRVVVVEPDSIQAQVICDVPLGDLILLPLGGSQRIEASVLEPLDPFRGS